MKRVLLIFSFVSLMVACEEGSVPNVEGDIHLKISDKSINKLKSDPFELIAVSLINGELEILVQYGGGCSDHQFEAVWDGEFDDINGFPHVTVGITHDVVGTDNCDALILETLKIPVSDLFDEAPAETYGFKFVNASNTSREIIFNTAQLWVEQSEACNLELELKETICGISILEDMWFSLGEPAPGEHEYYLQPVLDYMLANMDVEPGPYAIGVKILFGYQYRPDLATCEAFDGPSLPVLINCIEEVE